MNTQLNLHLPVVHVETAGIRVAHVVFLSGGKDSTAMALELRERNPDIDYIWVCTPTGNELASMVAHWENLGRLLGKEILMVSRPGGLRKAIADNRSLPNFRMRWCTRQLKIEQAHAFYLRLRRDGYERVVSYVGLRADEEERTGGIFSDLGDWFEQRFPLREWGMGLVEVLGCLERHGVCVPARTDCAWCPFQRVKDWYFLWRDEPEQWAEGEALEEEWSATFRSDGRDTWPASMKGMAQEFRSGRKIRGLRMLEDGSDASSACRVCRM